MKWLQFVNAAMPSKTLTYEKGSFSAAGSYLSSQPLVEPASDHAAAVGLDRHDGPQSVPEGAAHQEAAAATLEQGDSLARDVVVGAHLPGAHQGLEAREARPHLAGGGRDANRRRQLKAGAASG